MLLDIPSSGPHMGPNIVDYLFLINSNLSVANHLINHLPIITSYVGGIPYIIYLLFNQKNIKS